MQELESCLLASIGTVLYPISAEEKIFLPRVQDTQSEWKGTNPQTNNTMKTSQLILSVWKVSVSSPGHIDAG